MASPPRPDLDPAIDPRARMPRQIPYIIANEGCERFSFYGMRNILTTFLAASFFGHLAKADANAEAKDIFHIFVAGVYFFPLLGGWLADRFFGKYKTILWVSLIYCVGHACLAMFEDEPTGFYVGLGLIALGSGGIKPLVSTFMGDQFDQHNKHRAKLVFDAFYWIINFGSFFASLTMPKLLEGWGPNEWWGWPAASVAFGIPGVLMLLATFFFWLGRHKYVNVPPAPPDPHSFLRVARTALLAPGQGTLGMVFLGLGIAGSLAVLSLVPIYGLYDGKNLVIVLISVLVLLLLFGGLGTWVQLEGARGKHPDEAVDGVRAVLRVLIIFALVTPFWSLFDQKASTWVFQAQFMTKPSWFEPAQMQALNPALVMILIPLNNLVVYPLLRSMGFQVTQLSRMSTGIALAGVSFVAAGVIQLVMDNRGTLPFTTMVEAAGASWQILTYDGSAVSIVWQLVPYVFLTLGEVLVSATGLEFAYSQAPKSMKGVIMAFWSLAVTVGNLWVLLANSTVKRQGVNEAIVETGMSVNAFQLFFFAVFAFLAAFAFVFVARRYRMVDNYRVADK